MKLVERANSGLHSHIAEKISALKIAKNASVLDLGCGTGAFLARLGELGYTSLNGMDIALPEKNLDGINFKEFDLDARDMPYSDASLDLIVSVEVFEHIENMGFLVKEIARILTPRGFLIITTPNVNSIEARLRYLFLGKLKQFDEIGDPTHIYPVFMHSFTKILNRHALEVVDLWGYPLDGSSPTSRGSLRTVAKLLKIIGLSATPAGDHLCLVIRRQPETSVSTARSKREVVSSHY